MEQTMKKGNKSKYYTIIQERRRTRDQLFNLELFPDEDLYSLLVCVFPFMTFANRPLRRDLWSIKSYFALMPNSNKSTAVVVALSVVIEKASVSDNCAGLEEEPNKQTKLVPRPSIEVS